jgi:hypothetical protein
VYTVAWRSPLVQGDVRSPATAALSAWFAGGPSPSSQGARRPLPLGFNSPSVAGARRLCDVLDEGHAGVDAQWFANQLARAAIPKDMLTSYSVAVDGTDVESWGALRGATFTVELDGEAAATQLVDETDVPPVTTKKVKTANVFGIGPDGRKCYTPDPDARAGHRSATASRNAGPYVGYELHLAVQTRDVRWTNYIDKTTLGPEVPGVITTCNLVAAGTHRGGAIVDALIASKKSVHDITDVVWDPGYSLCLPGTTAYPLTQAGIEQTIELVTHQRGIRPFAGEALLVDGQLYSPMLPKELRTCAVLLATPPVPTDGPIRSTSTSGPVGAWCATPLPTATASPGGVVPSVPACSEAATFRRPCVVPGRLRWWPWLKRRRTTVRAPCRPRRPSFPSRRGSLSGRRPGRYP